MQGPQRKRLRTRLPATEKQACGSSCSSSSDDEDKKDSDHDYEPTSPARRTPTPRHRTSASASPARTSRSHPRHRPGHPRRRRRHPCRRPGHLRLRHPRPGRRLFVRWNSIAATTAATNVPTSRLLRQRQAAPRDASLPRLARGTVPTKIYLRGGPTSLPESFRRGLAGRGLYPRPWNAARCRRRRRSRSRLLRRG